MSKAPSGHARRPKQRRRVRWTRLGLFLLVAYLAVSLVAVEARIIVAKRNVTGIQRQIHIEQQLAELLEAEIAYRDSNQYIELVARRDLGLVKPGEVPVLMGVSR